MFLGRHFTRSLILASASAFLIISDSLAETYIIDKTHSSVNFSIRHLVSRTSGRFDDFSGTIQFNPENPEMTQVEATIQVASIDTDNDRRDAHLRSPDFFDAEKYPTITFKSSKAEKKAELLMLTGDLTMHGVTQKIILPIVVLGTGTHPVPQMKGAPIAGFETETVIKRSDYGITNWADPAGVLGDEVKVHLTIEAVGEAAGD